jgi:hypothetical protein
MRQAAEIEDKNEKNIVTPGGYCPRESCSAICSWRLKRPAEALREIRSLATARAESVIAVCTGAGRQQRSPAILTRRGNTSLN